MLTLKRYLYPGILAIIAHLSKISGGPVPQALEPSTGSGASASGTSIGTSTGLSSSSSLTTSSSTSTSAPTLGGAPQATATATLTLTLTNTPWNNPQMTTVFTLTTVAGLNPPTTSTTTVSVSSALVNSIPLPSPDDRGLGILSRGGKSLLAVLVIIVAALACWLVYNCLRRVQDQSEHVEPKRDGSEGSGPLANAYPESQNTEARAPAPSPAPLSAPLLSFDAQRVASEHGASLSTAFEKRVKDPSALPEQGIEGPGATPEPG